MQNLAPDTNLNQNKKIGRCIFIAKGSFNPGIFYPDWFERHSIMPAEEIEPLLELPRRKEIPDLKVVLEYGSRFFVEPLRAVIDFKSLPLRVERDSFEMWCEQRDNFPFMIDVIKKIFRLLPETPIKTYGLNFDEHYQCEEDLNFVSKKLFSPEESLKDLCGDNCRYGHILSFNKENAKINIIIQASQLLEGGIFFKSNFHYENPELYATFVTENIEKEFQRCLEFADKVVGNYFENIVSRVDKIPRI